MLRFYLRAEALREGAGRIVGPGERGEGVFDIFGMALGNVKGLWFEVQSYFFGEMRCRAENLQKPKSRASSVPALSLT